MADNLSQTVVGLGYVPVDRGDWEKNYQSNPETRYFNDNITQYKGSAFIADVTAENAEGNAGTEDSPRYYITAKPYEENIEELNPGWKIFASDAEFAIKYFAQFFTGEENPEFCYVIVDKDKKILFGFHWDGEPYFGVGCPSQIREYVEQRISEVSPENYEQVLAFLQDYLGSDTTLKLLLDGKVDAESGKSLMSSEEHTKLENLPTGTEITEALDAKVDVEEGKSLINSDFASTQESIESPEYLQVITDSESKILQGIKSDGTSYIGSSQVVEGDLIVNRNVSINGIVDNKAAEISSVNNPEYIDVKIDSENKILEGITTDGIKKINIPVDNGAAIIESIDNPEYIEAKVDAKGKLIEGINKNGEKIFGVIPPQIKQYIDENMPTGGSGIQSIEYDDATGDMYATYDDEGGITDVSMEPNGDIYVEYEE